MARILVTGGCGFIGSHLVDALQSADHHVVVVDNLTSGRIENLAAGTELIISDIVDRERWASRVQNIDAVYHLAAVASVERCNRLWVESHRTNLTGTLTVFDVVRAMPHRPPVVYASSAAVYGDQTAQPIKEESPLAPLSPYGVDKLACEMHARIAGILFGVSSVGMRFFNVYGPRQDPRSVYSGVISIFLDRIARGQPVTIYGDGASTRDFVYVEDVAAMMMRAMDLLGAKAQVHLVNVCTGQGTRIDRLMEVICRTLGREPSSERAPPRTGDIRASVGSPDHLRALLGTGCETSLEHGLRVTASSLLGEIAP